MSESKRVAAKPVTDGRNVRWTLEQVEQQTQQKVRIDWLRFTLPLDAVVKADPACPPDLDAVALLDKRGRDLIRTTRGTPIESESTGAMSVARSAASQLSRLLGVFEVGAVEDKGMDYYSARCALVHEGKAVGWCLAGGRSINQAATVHVNLFGAACLFISPAKWIKVQEWISQSRGHITRVDLAVDVWEGDDIADMPAAYLAGAFDVMGKRPSQTENGSWTSGHSRTFNVGKRETGKMLRAYEKGDEQFGHEAADPWIRYEVELRNNARVIPCEVLERPADFFAGAYAFCEALLQRLEVESNAQRVATCTRLADVSAQAAVTKSAKWFKRVAAPTLCALLTHGGDLIDFIAESEAHRFPSRLTGFARSAVADAFAKVAAGFAPPASPSIHGA